MKRAEVRTRTLEAVARVPQAAKLDLRQGRWQDVFAHDFACDCLIVDPPYSARTHDADTTRADSSDAAGLTPQYDYWTPEDVETFVAAWSIRTKGWMIALTDSELLPAWRDAYRKHGRYAFAPLPCGWRGMSTRISGDGPASWCVYAVVARPATREFASWGTLPGFYTELHEADLYKTYGASKASGGRGKPLWLLSALVRDYSLPGQVVCDPMCGWGSTLVAAMHRDRRIVGGEMDATAYADALVNLTEAKASPRALGER